MVEIGSNMVAGVRPDKILSAVKRMLEVRTNWRNPFDDGHARTKIIDNFV